MRGGGGRGHIQMEVGEFTEQQEKGRSDAVQLGASQNKLEEWGVHLLEMEDGCPDVEEQGQCIHQEEY